MTEKIRFRDRIKDRLIMIEEVKRPLKRQPYKEREAGK